MSVSIRTALNRIALYTLLVVGLGSAVLLLSYFRVKQSLIKQSISESLFNTSKAQGDLLLASILVPEQESAVPRLLEQFKKDDHLEKVGLVQLPSELPPEFGHCQLTDSITQCTDHAGDRILIVVPLFVGDQHSMYLYKIRKFPKLTEDDQFLLSLESTGAIIVISFLLLSIFLGKLASRELPTDLDALAKWVEGLLYDKSSDLPPTLKFRELKHLAQQLAEMIQKYEKMSDQAMIGQLTSGIMHDIRTPLHSIITAVHLAQEQPEGSPKRIARLENLLKVSTSNMPIIGGIIESTLDSSRDIYIELKTSNIYDTIQRSIQLYDSMFLQRNIEIQFKKEEAPLLIPHDPNQMGRVFSNIIKNSIDSFEKPVPLKHILVSVAKLGDNWVRIKLEDSGPGLPEDPEKVFRAFKSSKAWGTGLGLLTSKRIVEAHHGRITPSRSSALGGACFDIYCPIGENHDKMYTT